MHNSAQQMKPRSRVHEWKPTDNSKMHVFLGFLYLQEIIHKREIGQYFSRQTQLNTPSFYHTMTGLWFSLLQRFLHFVDNDFVGGGGTPSKLFKLKPITDKFCENPENCSFLKETLALMKVVVSYIDALKSNRVMHNTADK